MKLHVLAVLERHYKILKQRKCAIFGQNGQYNFFKTATEYKILTYRFEIIISFEKLVSFYVNHNLVHLGYLMFALSVDSVSCNIEQNTL